MKSRITLIKSYKNKETLRLMEVQELADMIRSEEYSLAVSEFRRELLRFGTGESQGRAQNTRLYGVGAAGGEQSDWSG